MSDAPQHPTFSLAYFKKLAKRLARGLKRGEPTAAERAGKYFADPSAVTLAGAQLVIAREHGYPSWRALRASVDSSGYGAVGGREPEASAHAAPPSGEVVPLSNSLAPSLSARDVIRDLIDHESEPLTDARIAEELSKRGISVDRRTVAKYREQFGILPSILRRDWRR